MFSTCKKQVSVISSAHYGDYFAVIEEEIENEIAYSKGVDCRAVDYAVLPAKSPSYSNRQGWRKLQNVFHVYQQINHKAGKWMTDMIHAAL